MDRVVARCQPPREVAIGAEPKAGQVRFLKAARLLQQVLVGFGLVEKEQHGFRVGSCRDQAGQSL